MKLDYAVVSIKQMAGRLAPHDGLFDHGFTFLPQLTRTDPAR